MTVRDTAQRRADVLEKLRSEVDLWVASAGPGGEAYLIPLSFYWDGARLVVATPGRSRTAVNLRRAGWARMAIGPTRDVVIVEGALVEVPAEDDPALAEAHARAAGFDARQTPGYVFFVMTPERIQAWSSPAELPGRDVMRGGTWL